MRTAGGKCRATPFPRLGWPGTKNAQPHRVWISAPAREVIAAIDARGYIFAGSRGGPVNNIDVTMREICERLGVERATPHDLRRTFGTRVTKLSCGRDAMDSILNHKKGKRGKKKNTTDVYDRHEYADDDKKVMEKVAAHIVSLVVSSSRDELTNVVQMR